LIKEENFQEVLESCWSQCRHQSTFKLLIFVFLTHPEQVRTNAGSHVRRLTSRRLSEAAERIRNHVNNPQNNTGYIGPIAQTVWSTAEARQTTESETLEMPQSFIFQQAMALDQEELEDIHIEDENKGILHVCFSENGPEVPLIVNINELRRLVGLPSRTAVVEMLQRDHQTINQNVTDDDHENSE
jgi:hypothetical protein